MPKRTKINKSELVKDYLASHPTATPTEVSNALRRFNIPARYVSNIKTMMKSQGAAPKRKRRRGRPKGREVPQTNAKAIVAAAQLIQTCGGVQEATEAIKTAERVASAFQG